jgi:hypothetical protein
MTAALPMGGQKITGMADPTVPTDAVTKNYADTAIAAFFSTGDVKLTIKAVADTGWILCDNSTIGNIGSGATYTGSLYQALYTLMWNNIADTWAPVTGGRGASAAADWAGLKKMTLLWMTGRALGVAGSGGSLTTRALGQYVGVESEALTLAQLPTGITSNGTNNIAVDSTTSNTATGSIISSDVVGGAARQFGSDGANVTIHSTGVNNISVTSNNTSGAVHSLMQPTLFLNAMIKL